MKLGKALWAKDKENPSDKKIEKEKEKEKPRKDNKQIPKKTIKMNSKCLLKST